MNLPEGVFGNRNALTRCTAADFALTQCPSSSQAGIVTIRANYEGEAAKLSGTAPIFNLEPQGEQPALFGFIVPTIDVPVSIPVSVRTATDYGLRFTVAELTQLAPLTAADLTFWAYPAASENDAMRFLQGAPGNPAGCDELEDTSCIEEPVGAAIVSRPMINNPSVCSEEELDVSLMVTTYQDPEHPTEATAPYPASTGCYAMTFKPVLLGTPTTAAVDSASGLDLTMTATQSLGTATTPSPIHAAILTLPEELTINPDAADGQSACPDALAKFGSESPGACPDNAKIGTFGNRISVPGRPRYPDVFRSSSASRCPGASIGCSSLPMGLAFTQSSSARYGQTRPRVG